MTSTEFARRYRLLKNVANRGARSFLAQQVDLGRMVMVHYLDSESPQQRVATLGRLNALTRPARDKLLEIADVDGSPVAVTLFITSFTDFATWLDSVSSAVATPVVTAQPPLVSAPPPVASAPPPRSVPVPQPAGDFTLMFGKLEAPPPSAAPAVPELASQPRAEPSWPPVAPSPAAEMTPPPIPSFAESIPPAAPNESASNFTAIFGAYAAAPAKRDLPQSLPPLPETGRQNRVMAPVAPAPEMESSPSPSPALPEAPPPGEFTQLFQRLSPSAPPSAPTNGTVPPSVFDSPRSVDAVRHADAGHAPAVPDVMSGFGGAPLGLRPPAFGDSPSTPPSPAGGNIMSRVGADAGPSEFTRMLAPIVLPSAPAAASAPPVAAKSDAPAEPPAVRPKKSMVPLIVALNVVVLLTIAIVAYFVLRR